MQRNVVKVSVTVLGLLAVAACADRAEPVEAEVTSPTAEEAAPSPVVPPARQWGHLVDAGTGGAVLVGGVGPDLDVVDVWQFEPDQQRWLRLDDETGPGARGGAIVVPDGPDGLLVIGGTRGMAPSFPPGGWRFSTADRSWSPIEQDGLTERRWAAAAADAERGVVLAFGGEGQPGQERTTDLIPLDDTWELDRQAGIWTTVAVRRPPPPRYGAVAVSPPGSGQLLVWGGRVGEVDETPGTVWHLDPTTGTWTSVATTAGPAPRWWAGGTFDAETGRLIVTGGLEVDPASAWPAASDETWAFDPRTGVWERLADLPEPAFSHALGAIEGGLVLFGGGTDPETWSRGHASDRTWRYDAAADRWEVVGGA